MSATNIAVLLAAASAAGLGAAVLHTVRGLRGEIAELRSQLTERPERAGPAERAGPDGPAERSRTPAVPPARTSVEEEIRRAVAAALADERERELAEARAFWAEQEARDDDAPPYLGAAGDVPGDVYIPRQSDLAGLEPRPDPDESAGDGEPADLAAARRRHPSHPGFRPSPDAVDHERTVSRLEDLAAGRTPLTDVRLGPLGTLDVYVFADGTTLCLSPGHRDTAERLADALDGGMEPVLLGGSAVSGAFALTFDCAGENVYILADRVIASL